MARSARGLGKVFAQAGTAQYGAPMPWFVYLARCNDGTLYTGIALDVAARIAAHDAGKGARYTRGRGPLALCAVHPCETKGEALRLEHRIKRLNHARKAALASEGTLGD